MKNYKLNLIKGLWDDSHEKQKPQRFARYAAMLIMLLTLGVGQMWGGASWIGKSFIVFNGTWYNGSGTGQSKSFDGQTLGKISSLTLGGEVQTYGQSSGTSNPARMYYKFDSGSSAYLTMYWFKYESNNNFFHTNSNGSTTSGNAFASKSIDISGLSAGNHTLSIWFYQPDGSQYDSNNSNNYVATITVNPLVTFKANGGTGSDYTQRVTYNTNTTLTSNTFTKTGYDFAGWATSADGNVVYANGATVKLTAHTNLFAKWTPKETTVTLTANAPGGETVTGGGTTVTATYDAVLPSFTALSCTGGYALTGYWTKATGDATKVINANGTFNANSGIWNRTDGATLTLYARWSLDRTLTYDDNGSTGGSVPASPTVYANGASVTVLGNTNSLVKTGYTFTGWNTAPGGGGTSYSAGSSITMNNNYTLYAQWQENMTTVNLVASPAGGGTFTVGGAAATSTTAGVTTTRSVAAVPYVGYRIVGSNYWTAQNANISLSSRSTNPTTVTGGGSGGSSNLTATFTQTYAYLQGRMTIYTTVARSTKKYIASSDGGYDASSNKMKMEYDGTNHWFYLHTYMTPKELSTAQTDGEQYFHFKTSTSSSSDDTNAQVYAPSTGRTLTAAGTGNKKETGSSDGSNNIWFDDNSTTNGYAIIYFDEAGAWYEVEHSLAYNVNGGSGTLPTTTCHLHGTNGTVGSGSSISKSQYTFSGWNTAQYITGTSYAAGDAITMNANTTLYAKWTRSVTLNRNTATSGSTSVTATYNCATLPSITNPSKEGYTFGGWNTANDGSGNIVINTDGEFLPITGWCDSQKRFTRTASDATLYAKWTQTITLNANTSNHGSGDNTSATIILNATAKSSITHCTPATGYQLEGYYTAASGGTKILNADGGFAGSSITVDAVAYISSSKWVKAGATTLYAHYTAKTYDVILDVNGATSGSDQTVVATFDAAMPTTQKTSGAAITAPSKTGYNFGGYFANNTGTGTQYYTNALASNHIWDVATNNTHIYAKWTAKTTDITLDQTGAASSGSVTTRTGTYNADMPAITGSGSLPTAPQGYAFMGYYDALEPLGNKYYNDDGTSARTWNKEDAEVTLYAYFKNAEVTNLVAAPGVIAPGETITITPTIEPTPTGTTKVCYELQYSNGTPLPSQPTFTPGVGNAVSFPVPSASATYIIQATLAKGSSCPANPGDVLSTRTTTFQVAGAHDVTVKYMCGDLTIKASEVLGEIRPLTWSDDITAPTITGYTFARWDAGDGVTIKDGSGEDKTTSTSSTIQIKAVYDGTLTAVYTKKRMIYFYNTLNWGSVYVYFYKNDSYWQTGSPYNGSGANTLYTWTNTPYSEGLHGQMLPVSEGSNIYYFDAEAAGVNASYDDVVFTEHQQHGYNYFYETNAVRRGDYKTTMPMFVPLADQEADVHNKTNYYNSGYWMNYPENSGYTLKIYNAYDATKETAAVQSIAFPYSEDLKMPLKLDVELSDGYNHNYWFMVYRNDGTYMGGIYTFKQGYQDEQVISGGNNKNQITTSAPGNYTFTLTYHDNGSGTVNYYIDVDFPIATGDYRIYYSDNATWSHGAHIKDSWYHPSHSIGKATTAKKDTVSFFIPKGVGISHTMKFQKASVTNEGAVTWADVAGGSITIPSSVTTTGVYNFIVSQPAGGASISLEKVEPYTGNFYIRTDCAGNTKWDSFKNVDHQMTYSDYAEAYSGYSHYFVHWVEKDNNIKFTIANDYSMCISDTLVEDYGTTIANISNIGALNSASANIRFMWNKATNKISRAYIGGSSNISDRFLVLEGDARMYDEDGNVLTDAGGGKISGLEDYEMNLVDDQNFVYERTIQVKTTARAKLTAKYNNNVQYFKGSSGDFAEGTTIQLLGGEASDTKHTMRIVYDFKTNRLVTAYVPSGTIESDLAINADLMIVREHQNAGQQLLFNGGSLSDVHTVYGVMRFNKWTLNNKETTGGHSIVGDPKSAYERSVFWISFPFDVKLSDVFGFGTYGVDWIIEYYDGAARAAEGYWADSKGFWKYVMPSQRSTYELKAGKGYALVLDLARMKDDNEDFWPNSIEQVELFFPSTGNVGGIEATDVTTTAESHLYDAAAHPGHADDRTYKDSHWNMIGVPSYANYGTTLTSDGSTTITWSTPVESDLPYLYEWNAVDNTYTAQTGSTYPFKSMHSYMVQYHGSLYWSLASATPTPVTPIVARRTYAEKPQNVELRLELSQNEKMIDQTFVRLSNDEEVSAAFKFDEDLSKEMNKNKANIYTMIADLSVAGNTMPMSEQTTVVPVGVKIAADGDYTFAIPDGTEGIGVTLVDTETGIRTSLSALDYTVNLSAGTYNERFVLEISPIKQTPTGIENSEVSHQHSDTRKVLIDGILYIVKDGKMFDARGAVVK
jgi:uncharacterized repeat protein (TIGR02543 family)